MNELTFSEYHSRVRGGWAGKVVGGTLGGPFEGQRVLHAFTDYQQQPSPGSWLMTPPACKSSIVTWRENKW